MPSSRVLQTGITLCAGVILSFIFIFTLIEKDVDNERIWGMNAPYPQGLMEHRPPIASMDYWKNQKIDVEAIVGDTDVKISLADIRDSKRFLLDKIEYLPDKMEHLHVLDIGAGFGRVVDGLLIPLGFQSITLIDQKKDYIKDAEDRLKKLCNCNFIVTTAQLANREWKNVGHEKHFKGKMGGKNHFKDKKGGKNKQHSYGLIVMQWLLGYMPDFEIVAMLKNLITMKILAPDGVIFLKDNITPDDYLTTLLYDDTEVIRHRLFIRWLFLQAGMREVTSRLQTDFPEDWFHLQMSLYVIDKRPHKERNDELLFLQSEIYSLYRNEH